MMAWLDAAARTVVPSPPSIIHWDFHPSNVLVHHGGDLSVIDWTAAEISDYRFDLASTLLFLGNDEQRDRLVEQYSRSAGRKVEDLDFFVALACCRRLLLIAIVLSGQEALLGLRPELGQFLKGRVDREAGLLRQHLGAATGVAVPDVTSG